MSSTHYDKPEYPGDSRPDTQKHIDLVNEYGKNFTDKLLTRLVSHDASKLVEPEHKYFDQGTPELKKTTFGEQDYDSAKDKIKEGIEHHYRFNDHHPEHFGKAGVSGMNLYQLVEMYLDWRAASKRHDNGNIFNSIQANLDKFPERNFGKQVYDIFLNTAMVDEPSALATADDKVKEYLAGKAGASTEATEEKD